MDEWSNVGEWIDDYYYCDLLLFDNKFELLLLDKLLELLLDYLLGGGGGNIDGWIANVC